MQKSQALKQQSPAQSQNHPLHSISRSPSCKLRGLGPNGTSRTRAPTNGPESAHNCRTNPSLSEHSRFRKGHRLASKDEFRPTGTKANDLAGDGLCRIIREDRVGIYHDTCRQDRDRLAINGADQRQRPRGERDGRTSNDEGGALEGDDGSGIGNGRTTG